MHNFFGKHCLLDCTGCNDLISSREHILNFNKEIIQRIDMKPVGEPKIKYLLEGEINEGFSLLQLIVTSNLTAHFVTRSRTAYIDIFSCKNFDTDTVRKIVYKYFSPTCIKTTLLTRDA